MSAGPVLGAVAGAPRLRAPCTASFDVLELTVCASDFFITTLYLPASLTPRCSPPKGKYSDS